MDLLSVRALLQQGIFKIPSYQRGYSWQHKQVQDFIEDLQEAIELKEHYTGTVTVIEKGSKTVRPKTFTLFDVVDGQQRLTTITIFIYCIHNRLKNLGIDADSLGDIIKNIIYKTETTLQLHNEAQEFYRDYILDKSTTEIPSKYKNKAQQNLSNAKKQISRFLDSYKKLDEIWTFYDVLMDKFRINLYILSKESDVGVVFETMNNRGLPLTKMDMVKNYLVYLASRLNNEPLAEKINRYFGEVYENLMMINASPKQEDEMLRHSYIIYTGVNGDDIYIDVKN